MTSMIKRLSAAVFAAGSAGAVIALTTAGVSSAATVKAYTTKAAVTKISGRPDSGIKGNNWANDKITRSVTLHLVGEVPLTYCGGPTGTGHCYHWTGKLTDNGTFATISGQLSPGGGDLNGGSEPTMGANLTGPMHGTYSYDFYSSWKSANAGAVESTEKDAGTDPTGDHTTGAWPEQFFGSTAKFFESNASSDELGSTGGWTYNLGFGADSSCPNLASQWVDASPDWGADATSGNILAPGSAAGC